MAQLCRAAKRANWYTDQSNVIAFSKGSMGWVALFNNGTADKQIHVQTGLSAGTYCDIIHDKTLASVALGRPSWWIAPAHNRHGRLEGRSGVHPG
jgi:alpha-amylase